MGTQCFPKALGMVMILTISVMSILLLSETRGTSFIDTESMITSELKGKLDYTNEEYDDSHRNGIKTMDIRIEGMSIIPSSKYFIYPSITTYINIRISNVMPETVKIIIDKDNADNNIIYSASDGFTVSEHIIEYLSISTEKSYIYYNSSLSLWDVNFAVIFDWSFPCNGPFFSKVIATDEKGYKDEFLSQQGYLLERDLFLGGEILLSSTDPEALSPDMEYIRGNSFLVLSGIYLHFKSNAKISPEPNGFKMGVFDDRGNYWEYFASGTNDLKKITFSFQVPNMDGPTTYFFLVHTFPKLVKVYGNIEFDIDIDSTSPKVWDFKLTKNNDTILSWKLNDEASGISYNSLRIRLERSSSLEIIDWFKPEDVIWSKNTVDIVLDIPLGEYYAQIKIKDNVGNVNPFEATYYFSTKMKPIHDISIDNEPYTYPKILISGYETIFYYSISNKGSHDENDIEIHFFIDEKLSEIFLLGHLPAGSKREIRFHMTPSLKNKQVRLILDPNSMIMDEDTSNNELITHINVYYRDINIDIDSLTSSNPNPDDMEQVMIAIRVNNIGDIESGIIKIIFLENERFHGEYHISSIPSNSWDILSFQWKVKYNLEFLSFIIDPYNEIFESDENNRFNLDNPFYKEEQTPYVNNNDNKKTEDQTPIDENQVLNEVETQTGNTIWLGPVQNHVEEKQNFDSEIIVLEPPLSEEEHGLPTITIPILGFTITTTMLAGILLALKNEPLRFKLLLMAFPLYTKLKKTKIEHGTRFEILGYLKAKPGANYTELKENLDLNDGSLIHHIRILEREEKIYSKRVGKFKLFYVTSYRREPSISDYISPIQKRILELIYKNPGIVPKTLSGILDRSQTDISYHLTELSRNGFLEKKRKGKNIQYYLRDEYMETLLS